MARKRKTRTSEASEQPEPVQTLEPEPESETDQSDPAEAVEEEPEVEEEEQEEEEQTDNISDEPKNGTVSADLENKPSDNAILQANGEGKNDEEELEEDTLEKLLEPFSKDQLILLIKEAVAKHSDILENVQKLADADQRIGKFLCTDSGGTRMKRLLSLFLGSMVRLRTVRWLVIRTQGNQRDMDSFCISTGMGLAGL